MASPRYATPRNPDRPTWGPAVARAAAALGRPFLPHQQLLADVVGEIDPATGLPVYGQAIVVLPRRGGKTVWTLASLVERLRRGPEARCFYTAQTAEDATKVLRDEWAPIIQSSPLDPFIGFRYARGDAGFYVRIGARRLSRTEVFTPNANALHGRDADLIAVDEVWSFTAAQGADIEAGTRPARWARPGAQLLYVSAGGTEASGWLNDLVDLGRAGLPGIAYFEWSADPEDPNYDPTDEALWWATHPGLSSGLVGIGALRDDAAAMGRREFERALLCVWPRTAGTAMLAGWEALLAPTATPAEPLTLAFDVHPERTSAAVAVAGGGAVELVDHRPGVGWLPDRLAALAADHGVGVIARDPAGQAGATALPDLQVTDLAGPDVAAACAALTDAIAAAAAGSPTLRLRPHPALGDAMGGARTYNRGDGRAVWARRTSDADLTPLYAVTIAAWASQSLYAGAIY